MIFCFEYYKLMSFVYNLSLKIMSPSTPSPAPDPNREGDTTDIFVQHDEVSDVRPVPALPLLAEAIEAARESFPPVFSEGHPDGAKVVAHFPLEIDPDEKKPDATDSLENRAPIFFKGDEGDFLRQDPPANAVEPAPQPSPAVSEVDILRQVPAANTGESASQQSSEEPDYGGPDDDHPTLLDDEIKALMAKVAKTPENVDKK